MTLFAVLTLVAALGPIAWLVHATVRGRRQWLVASSTAAAMSISALLVGPWALLSVYLRPIIALALIGALVFTASRAARRGAHHDQRVSSPWRLVLQIVVAGLFAVVVMNALTGRVPPPGTIDLRFPLKGGTHAVLQGGASLVLNPFHRWFRSDKYALDLVRLNVLGNRGRGVAPARLTEYASFHDSVHSPCTGITEEVRANVPDNAPGDTDPQHRTGNYVLLRCGAHRVLLAHLERGSLAVSEGDTVHAGQLVGRVGNSGNTSEPHLHVSAMVARSGQSWPDAEAVPVTFDGRFLTINDVVRSVAP
jgi:hypothetical protein